MALTAVLQSQAQVLVARHNTRCRSCWLPIAAGEPIHPDSANGLVFHTNCPPVWDGTFPIIGQAPLLQVEEPDNVYHYVRTRPRSRFGR